MTKCEKALREIESLLVLQVERWTEREKRIFAIATAAIDLEEGRRELARRINEKQKPSTLTNIRVIAGAVGAGGSIDALVNHI